MIAASFAAGLNVYATVLTLGVLARVHWVELPPGLEVLANGWVIAASAAMFSIEFFADKVPAFDLIWNALHTFVRIPLAALLAYRATLQLSPEMQLLATVGGALIAHGRPFLEDRGPDADHSEPGTNFQYRAQRRRRCGRHRSDMDRNPSSMDCRGHCRWTHYRGDPYRALDMACRFEDMEKAPRTAANSRLVLQRR